MHFFITINLSDKAKFENLYFQRLVMRTRTCYYDINSTGYHSTGEDVRSVAEDGGTCTWKL